MNPADFDIEAGRAEWASFLPALLSVLGETTGNVLEVGVGHYSTPVLHAYCAEQDRELVSAEEDVEWGSAFRDKYLTRDHPFVIGSYDAMIPHLANEQWSVILLDHSPGPRRGKDLARLIDWAEFIVIHDYHLAIEEAVAPYLVGLNFHVCASKPPTLVVSKFKPIPASVLRL